MIPPVNVWRRGGGKTTEYSQIKVMRDGGRAARQLIALD